MENNSYYLETRHYFFWGGEDDVYTIDLIMTLRRMCYMC